MITPIFLSILSKISKPLFFYFISSLFLTFTDIIFITKTFKITYIIFMLFFSPIIYLGMWLKDLGVLIL